MQDNPQKQTSPNALTARLGLYTATMIVIGSVIGSGIFKKPALMAAQLHSPLLLLLTWILAGTVTLFGALTNAEVASMITAVGGQYVFFRRIYNKFVGYLYGWAVFAVIQTGSIASIAYIFAEYSNYFIALPHLSPAWEAYTIDLGGIIQITPFANFGVKFLTIFCILLLTSINIMGVVLGGTVQNIFTTVKVVAMMGIVLLAFSLGQGDVSSTIQFNSSQLTGMGYWGLLGALSTALSGAFWAYDGWNNITYIAGEVKSPSRNIPRALWMGTVIVLATYLLINLAYLYVLPFDQMSQSQLVAAKAMESIMGTLGGALISALVVVSTFGTANGTILASARVHFAMARDGLFFQSLGKVHPRFHTPARSLLLQGIWASVLVFTGTFDQLTDMLIFVSWIFYCLGALGVFVLRYREPHTPRPYRVWGYPLVPAVFVLFSAAYVLSSLFNNFRNSLLGLLLTASGIPLYIYWQRKQRILDVG